MTRRAWVLFSGRLVLLAGLGGAVSVGVGAADPLRVVLLVDSSTNMAPMLTEFRAGLHTFIDAVPEDVEITFISTGGQIRIRVPPTLDRQRLHDAASRFSSDGGANSFLDTMLESDQRFLKAAPDRRGVFVVVTTDPPTINETPLNRYNPFVADFMRRRGRAHAVVIRPGSQNTGVATAVMENLTKNTDGIFTVMAVGNSLPARMKEMAEQVAAQN
ncbi:MAG: VWA domain-containing protein [Vicinamibacterales bacterium]